jgi:hypothetical protein
MFGIRHKTSVSGMFQRSGKNGKAVGTKPSAGTCRTNRKPAIGGNNMKSVLIIGVALFASTLALTGSAAARLGMAPLATQDAAVIQVRGGHGHGHGHMGRGGRGHHYGWRHHR